MITAFIDEDILQEISDFCTMRGFYITAGKYFSGRCHCSISFDFRRSGEVKTTLPPLQEIFEMGYELCRLQEKRVTRDVIEYINRYIPPTISVRGYTYIFKMFPNHAHYDFRFCYEGPDRDQYPHDDDYEEFYYLVENISNDRDLLQDLQWLRTQLQVESRLDGDYATREGYTKKKYQDWLDESSGKKQP